jgi:peptide/nickel transport system substrate-binding protein
VNNKVLALALGAMIPIIVAELATCAASAAEVTVGQLEDADALDPSLGGTIGGREIFANMCQKLYDINEHGEVVPQLAVALPEVSADGMTATVKLRQGVKFNDGTTFDAAAVKTTLERDKTLTGSRRKGELASIKTIEAPDAATLVLHMATPSASLAASLSDRAGMIMSPAQLAKLGDKFGTAPVCIGPFAFVERVPGDRTVLKKSEYYYGAAGVALDRLVFRPIADESVRAANLEAGTLQVADRLGVSDAQRLKGNPQLNMMEVPSNAYMTLVLNTNNANGLDKPAAVPARPLANPKLRQAFELALDREQINQIIFQGTQVANCGPISPASPWYTDPQCPKRDVAAAKHLIAESGVATPVAVTILVPNNPTLVRMVQLIQSQESEAGINVQVAPGEVVAVATQAANGDFDVLVDEFSGRVDPDLNISNYHATNGGDNYSHASDAPIDALLDKARSESDPAKRKLLYAEVVKAILARRNLLYLYSEKIITGYTAKLDGYVDYMDGLPRLEHARLQP